MLVPVNTKNLKTLKYQIFSKKKLGFYIVCSRGGSKGEKIFKEESIEILTILLFSTSTNVE